MNLLAVIRALLIPVVTGLSRRINMRVCPFTLDQSLIAPAFQDVLRVVSFELCMAHVYQYSDSGIGVYCQSSSFCGYNFKNPLPHSSHPGVFNDAPSCRLLYDKTRITCDSIRLEFEDSGILTRLTCQYDRNECGPPALVHSCQDSTGGIHCTCAASAVFDREKHECACEKGLKMDEVGCSICGNCDTGLVCRISSGDCACPDGYLPFPSRSPNFMPGERLEIVGGAEQDHYLDSDLNRWVYANLYDNDYSTRNARCYHSANKWGSWVEVHFGQTSPVAIIFIRNRDDYNNNRERAIGIKVKVCEQDVCQLCATISDLGVEDWINLKCDPVLSGDRIRMEKDEGFMNLCEVVVQSAEWCERDVGTGRFVCENRVPQSPPLTNMTRSQACDGTPEVLYPDSLNLNSTSLNCSTEYSGYPCDQRLSVQDDSCFLSHTRTADNEQAWLKIHFDKPTRVSTFRIYPTVTDVLIGKHFIQFGDFWRLGAPDTNHLSLSYLDKNTGENSTAIVFHSNGTTIYGPLDVDDNGRSLHSTWSRGWGAAGISFWGDLVGIRGFRIGKDQTHLTVAHSSGNTAMIYRNDNYVFEGPRTDWNDFDKSSPSNILMAYRAIQIGPWRLGVVDDDQTMFSISHIIGAVPMLFHKNGTVDKNDTVDHPGSAGSTFDARPELQPAQSAVSVSLCSDSGGCAPCSTAVIEQQIGWDSYPGSCSGQVGDYLLFTQDNQSLSGDLKSVLGLCHIDVKIGSYDEDLCMRCSSGSKSAHRDQICDGRNDCGDFSDEEACFFKCGGTVFPNDRFLDGVADCADGSDEVARVTGPDANSMCPP